MIGIVKNYFNTSQYVVYTYCTKKLGDIKLKTCENKNKVESYPQ